MELFNWANGQGQTLILCEEDFDVIRAALVDAYNFPTRVSKIFTLSDGQKFEVHFVDKR